MRSHIFSTTTNQNIRFHSISIRVFHSKCLETMAEIQHHFDLYQIPSNGIVNYRREFYRLKRENYEEPQAWLDRVQNHIVCCAFPKFIEYILIDKFMCELNADEIESIRSVAIDSWTFEQLHVYFGDWKFDAGQPLVGDVSTAQNIDSNRETEAVDIKSEFVSYEQYHRHAN